MDTSEGTLRLAVPAREDYLATIRLFGAAAAPHLGGDTDSAEDLRLALSEASALVMAGAGPGSRIEITLTPAEEGGDIRVGVRRDGPPSADAARDDVEGNGEGEQDEAPGLALALLRALVTDLAFDGEDGTDGLTFGLSPAGAAWDTPAPGRPMAPGPPADG